MAQTIKLKRSSVSGNTPGTSDLELGEVAINTYDGKMFIKKNDGSDSIVEIGGGSGTVTEAFKTISVSGQSDVVADSATDTLTLVAGSNMTLTTNASGDTITFASSGGGGNQNLFSTFAVSGQNNVVADSTTDTLTFVAGSGITLTTDSSADSITIAATASAITVQDEGSALSTAATTLNFVGAGVTATGTGATKTITIPGGSGSSFGTIAVSGQGSVVADQANDTLTLVAGSNVTLTTSAAGDSVTIASSGGGGGGSVDAGASITEFKYDVSSSTTSFSGSDANSNTLAYTAGAVHVYLNGILLDPATDYTASNGTTVVLTDAAVSGDDLQIIAFNRKILNANTTVNTFTGDGSTTAFTLSTNPVNENNTNVFIDGVYQSKSNYSVSGTTLTFSSAPPNTSGIEVSLGFQQASISSTLDFADNAILRIGTGNDLQLLHDGSNSIIKDTGTGDLQIGASTLDIKNSSLNETMIKAVEDGAVELYHNNAKKLETVTGGVTVTGTVTATTFSGDLSGTVNTGTTGTTQSASDNSTKIATTAYVDTAVTNLVDSAPGTLNTLNELAAALGDDANFSTSVTNSLATKVGLTATTGAANMPAGTTAQRPGSPAAGQFRYNSTLSQFEGYTSSWGAIGGGGTNTFTTDIFTANGSATAFTLSQVVSSPNDCIVHIDGIYQTPTDAYTVSGTTLTFSSAPANTRKIVVYSVQAGVSGNNLNIQTFSGDGSATSFTMSINPINENNTIVHIDGVYQQKSSYSTSGTTLSFSAAPANGTTIEVATFTQTEINVPVNDTIDTVHIKDDAVTSAKLGGNLVAPGTVTASAGFVGPLTGNVTGNVSGTAATVTGAAQSNITSVGTLTGLTTTGTVTAPILITGAYGAGGSSGDGFRLNSTDLYGQVDASDKVRIAVAASSFFNGGNVGIGTAIPAGKLHVYSGDAGAVAPSSQADDLVVEASTEGGITIMTPDDQSARIRFTSPSTNSGDVGGATVFYRQNINKMLVGTAVSGGKLALASGATNETMLLDGNGRVAIGNSSPNALLHVGVGSAETQGSQANPAIQIGSTGGYRLGMYTDAEGAYIENKNGDDGLIFRVKTAGEAMRINAGTGKVGIGITAPATPLHVRNVGNPSGGNRNTVETVLTLDSTGHYPYQGYGVGIDFKGEDYGNTVIREYAKIQAVMTDSASQNSSGDPSFKSALTFWTNTGGASSTVATEKMRISNQGYVTKPYQPSDYRQASNTSGINASSGYHRIYFGTSRHAVNSMHSAYGGNSANGSKFTAPVAGRYFFSCTLRIDGFSGSYAYLDMRVNDTTRARHLDSETGSYLNRIVTGVYNLAVGDYITFEFISNGDSNVAMDADTYASVHLLG